MFLLIQRTDMILEAANYHLHSTMFLLIRGFDNQAVINKLGFI